ncbi:hypothetical protein [Klebsiella phage 05F01]|nr:hypothetical protein [Klebsiella phage 05F01]
MKRFGRNQKRKLKEEILNLKKKSISLEKEISWEKSKNNDYKYLLSLIEETFNQYFPLTETKCISAAYTPISMVRQEMSSSGYNFLSEKECIYNMTNRVLSLDTIKYRAEIDKLKDMYYLIVNTPEGGSVGWTQSFSELPEEAIEYLLKRDLLPMLVKEIKKREY